MEQIKVITALAALAQDSRLDVFRLLVQAGPLGLPAGEIAARLKLAPNTLSFHFERLRNAGLISVRRDGRFLIYTAEYKVMSDLLAYLTDKCCKGVDTAALKSRATKRAKESRVA